MRKLALLLSLLALAVPAPRSPRSRRTRRSRGEARDEDPRAKTSAAAKKHAAKKIAKKHAKKHAKKRGTAKKRNAAEAQEVQVGGATGPAGTARRPAPARIASPP